MSAQLARLNATASNLANAGALASSADTAFRPLRPVFTTISDAPGLATVQVERMVAIDTPPVRRHVPGHPMADAEGYVWEAPVDSSAELIDMVEAARHYRDNVEVLQTAKSLTLDTLRIGQ